MLDSLIREQLRMESERASKERALDLQERQISNQEKAYKDASSAAKVKGIVDTATTAGMMGLTYKALNKPSPMSELIAYQKGLAKPGAQTLLGGGGTASGAQVIPASTAFASGPEMAATTGQAAWVEPASASAIPSAGSALLSAAPSALALGGMQYMAGELTQPWMKSHDLKYTNIGGKYGGPAGATTGLMLDAAKKGASIAEDIGSDIGDIFGW